MSLDLATFNSDESAAREVLGACLDIPRWVDIVVAGTPFPDVDALRQAAWAASATIAWPEVATALARHPRIGERAAAKVQSGDEAAWSRDEQAGVQASEADRIAAGNAAYEARFGHIFLICAAGLSGAQILESLQQRISHDAIDEQPVVVEELRKIADLRLTKAVTG